MKIPATQCLEDYLQSASTKIKIKSVWGNKMRLIKTIILFVVVLLGGCATGVKYKDMASSIPPVAANKGRIFFYRNSTIVGAAIQPSIMVNGQKVGDSRPGGFFYIDRPPGTYEVTTTTEVETKRSVKLANREIKYMRSSLEMGVFVGHVMLELMYPETGEADIENLSYTGGNINPGGSMVASAAPEAPQSSDMPQASAAPQTPGDENAETWSGIMSCEARTDITPNRPAYNAKFSMELSGNSATVHRRNAMVDETLTGQVIGDKLELRGDGYRLETPNVKWQFTIAGMMQAGAGAYSGTGSMLTNKKAIRACELTMVRTSKQGQMPAKMAANTLSSPSVQSRENPHSRQESDGDKGALFESVK